MYIHDTIPLFEERLEALRRSLKTIIGYRSDVTNFVRCLDQTHNRPLEPSQVTVNDLWLFVRRLQESGKSGRSINRILHGLRAFFDFLLSQGLVTENLARQIPRVSEDKLERVFLEETELAQLIGATNDLIILGCLYMLTYTGVRVSELCLAQMKDLAKDLSCIHIKGKGRKSRTVALHPALQDVLRKYLHEHRDMSDPYQRVFCTHGTEALSPSTVNRWISELCQELGWEKHVTAHTIRHTFGYLYIQHGGDVVELMRILGHDSLGTTSIYTHKTPTQLADGIGRLPVFLP